MPSAAHLAQQAPRRRARVVAGEIETAVQRAWAEAPRHTPAPRAPTGLTSQSRHSLALAGSPPSAKLSIPLMRRDGREAEGARLESV